MDNPKLGFQIEYVTFWAYLYICYYTRKMAEPQPLRLVFEGFLLFRGIFSVSGRSWFAGNEYMHAEKEYVQ